MYLNHTERSGCYLAISGPLILLEFLRYWSEHIPSLPSDETKRTKTTDFAM